MKTINNRIIGLIGVIMSLVALIALSPTFLRFGYGKNTLKDNAEKLKQFSGTGRLLSLDEMKSLATYMEGYAEILSFMILLVYALLVWTVYTGVKLSFMKGRDGIIQKNKR